MESIIKVVIGEEKQELTLEELRSRIQSCTDSADVASLKIFLKAAKNQLSSPAEYQKLYDEFEAAGRRIITNSYDPFLRLFNSDCYELKPTE